MADFATPTFYLVLQKQRADAQQARLEADNARQVPQTHRVIVGVRLEGLRERLVDQGDGWVSSHDS